VRAACLPRSRLISADGVTRPEEIAAIDDFIARHGVRWYEPRFGDTTSAFVPIGVATSRIAALDTRSDPFAFTRLMHQLIIAWRR
jgi:hypothetical protein